MTADCHVHPGGWATRTQHEAIARSWLCRSRSHRCLQPRFVKNCCVASYCGKFRQAAGCKVSRTWMLTLACGFLPRRFALQMQPLEDLKLSHSLCPVALQALAPESRWARLLFRSSAAQSAVSLCPSEVLALRLRQWRLVRG